VEIKVDLWDDRRRDCGLQLEVAALAARSGYTVALEQRLRPGMPPSDVVLTHGPESLQVETFAIVQGKKSDEATAYWESMSSHIMIAELRHDVSVNGSISQKATLAVTGLVFDVRTGRTQLAERGAPLRS
jgi:hypothetical protein